LIDVSLAARAAALSLHDALPISDVGELPLQAVARQHERDRLAVAVLDGGGKARQGIESVIGFAQRITRRCVLIGVAGDATATGADRKSTRLNSSHVKISYAVFCL